MTASKTLFLVFMDEHSKHKDVVLKLASFLKADFGLTIFLDLYEQEEVYGNPAAWLEKASAANFVLVIWSPKTEERWRNPEASTSSHDLFTPLLKQMKEDLILKRNVSKYMIAYFEYCSDVAIPSSIRNVIPIFKLPSESKSMLLTLMKAKSQTGLNVTENEMEILINEKLGEEASGYYSSFKASVADMSDWAKINPLWT